MPLDNPDWQRETDRGQDPFVTINNAPQTGSRIDGPFQCNVYEGVDVFLLYAVDAELSFNWDTVQLPGSGHWRYLIEVAASVPLSLRLPNRGNRLQTTLTPADGLAHNLTYQIVPTARNGFGFDAAGSWYLVSQSGTIAGGATVNVPFQFPYHGPATLSVKCASGNYRCELQGRDSQGLVPLYPWAAVRSPPRDVAVKQVTVPPLINQLQLVNMSPASAAYTVSVVPSYQFT